MTTTPQPETGPSAASLEMDAVVARRYGTPDVVAVERVARPVPGDDQVLVEVHASSLNALDWHFLTGTPYLLRLINGLRRPKRIIPGGDVAGLVVAVGSNVGHHAVGDAVFGECAGGGFAEFVAVAADHVVSIPDDVPFDAAGATPVAGLTALQGLRTHASLGAGERVLINGAAGGVGTFAVQIAASLDAHVTAVCSTRNVEMVRRLGADTVIDYTTTDIAEHHEAFDVVLDNVGNRPAEQYQPLLRPGARFVAVSGPKDNRWLGPVPHLLRTRLALRHTDASFHQFTAAPNPDDLRQLGDLLASGAVTPCVDRTICFDDVADGLAEIGSGHARAKIVVTPRRS